MNYKLGCIAVVGMMAGCTSPAPDNFLEGKALYATVEKYVSFGDHRSGTPADNATSGWLSDELSASGYEVQYTQFPLNQFFFEDAVVTHKETNTAFKAFPLWYIGDNTPLYIAGELALDTHATSLLRGKIVLLNFSSAPQGQSPAKTRAHVHDLISAGVRGVIGYKENEADEIVAFNAPMADSAWRIPIVIVSPGDAGRLATKTGQPIAVTIKGKFDDVTVRNVYGTIGDGDEYIVVSTPISGWFSCGGERGPGVAIWLGLARWVAQQEDLPYTFVFTANSGHELGFWGAHEFLENDAPPVDKTKLCIHLGAGAATLDWKSAPGGLVKQHVVDSARSFFYTSSVNDAFKDAFQNTPGQYWDTNDRVGGELVNVLKKGYKNGVGISYSHPYFHTRGDSASHTSPAILEETALAFRRFVENVAHSKE